MKSAEIWAQIEQVNKEIYDLRTKREDLKGQYRDTLQSEFEESHGIKAGDKITTQDGTTLFYDCLVIDAVGQIVVLCHPIKKDGTPSGADRHYFPKDF